MADLAAGRTALSEATGKRDALHAELAGTGAQLAAERAALQAARAAGDGERIADAEARVAELGARRRATLAQAATITEQARVTIDALIGDELTLEGDVPLVLLPV